MSDFDIPRQQTDAALEAQLDGASEAAFQTWMSATRRRGSAVVHASLAVPGTVTDISTRLVEAGRPENRPDNAYDAQITQLPLPRAPR